LPDSRAIDFLSIVVSSCAGQPDSAAASTAGVEPGAPPLEERIKMRSLRSRRPCCK
jgi:hypothetical protein